MVVLFDSQLVDTRLAVVEQGHVLARLAPRFRVNFSHIYWGEFVSFF